MARKHGCTFTNWKGIFFLLVPKICLLLAIFLYLILVVLRKKLSVSVIIFLFICELLNLRYVFVKCVRVLQTLLFPSQRPCSRHGDTCWQVVSLSQFDLWDLKSGFSQVPFIQALLLLISRVRTWNASLRNCLFCICTLIFFVFIPSDVWLTMNALYSVAFLILINYNALTNHKYLPNWK